MASKKQHDVVDESTGKPDVLTAAPGLGANKIVDLAAMYPVWGPKLTSFPLQGDLLGVTELPSAQANQKYWTVYVIQLSHPTEVADKEHADENGTPKKRVANAGELVVVTKTAVLKKLEPYARDPRLVAEVFLAGGGTKASTNVKGGKIQLFKKMEVGNVRARSRAQLWISSPVREAELEGGSGFALPPVPEGVDPQTGEILE